MWRLAPWWLALALIFGGGCPADDDDSADDDAGDDDTGDDDGGDDDGGDDDTVQPEYRGACDLAEKIGFFMVQHEPDYSVVSGEVSNGVVPVTILENVGEEAGCTLMRRNNPFCDPPCDPGQTCDFDGSCIPYPEPRSVGNVGIDGLAKEVSMDYPTYYDTQMPHPGFDPGALVTLHASGEDYDGFTMFGMGVTPIESEQSTWTIHSGQPMDVSWTAADSDPVTINLRFNIDQHGNSPVTLMCDLPDTGSATIPAPLTDALIAFGVTGYPSGNIYRRTVDHIDVTDGCIQFEVYSHLQGNLEVEGHYPCDEPDDCPKGMECDFKINTCVPI
jgi:hypothetical protein